eukprot:CAMPEP_0117474332 /NCGR_PEP_ID=MMETSP0784-20121206/9230_1 /TAXON_ID=39447 /ORGANISM="" /LENGTH=444 /DNA_ID=CAMNT_0005268555 /DNA_START=33 /DNA_END=1367 /DNA_ORIENTATION=-
MSFGAAPEAACGDSVPLLSAPAASRAVEAAAASPVGRPLRGGRVVAKGWRRPSSFSCTSLEASLEAWASCRPEGYVLLASAAPLAQSSIVRYVPRSRSVPEDAALKLKEAVPQLLRVRAGRLHFLDFWAAFSKASRIVAGLVGEEAVADEGLGMELETVRDGILRLLEVTGSADEAGGTRAVATADLAKAVRSAAEMSKAPDFWQSLEASVASEDRDTFSLEDLGAAMMSWLQDAIVWQHQARRDANLELDDVAGRETSKCFVLAWPLRRRKPSRPVCIGLPVLLHIYDVSQEDRVRKLNRVLAHTSSPLKFGGIFHAGVEVAGLEWSFGMTVTETMCGVACVEPKSHPDHNFRETIELRRTKFSPEEIAELLSQLIEEYPGDDYCLLRRNCCHFADDFCRRLGVGGIPGWVHRLARIGALVDTTMQRVMNRKLISEESDEEDW